MGQQQTTGKRLKPHLFKLQDIEWVFLSILQEDINRDKIKKKIQDFNDIHWQELYGLVTEHGLFAIFYDKLRNLNLENIPSGFLIELKNLYLLNLRRNLWLERELLEILSLFRQQGIPVIPLKGPILAKSLYNDLTLRQTSCDLDLLVEKKRFKDAQCLLKNTGYSFSVEDKDNFRRSFKLKYSRQIQFDREASGLRNLELDLHWDIRTFFVDTPLEDFWRDVKEINFNSHKILMFSNENLLLYLAFVSLSTFEFVELRYLYDIHQLISRLKSDLDWQVLLQRTETRNFRTYLFFALKLSKDFFHTDIPKFVLGRLTPNPFKRSLLRIWINKKNILYQRSRIAPSNIWRYFISSYLSAKNIFDCIRIIKKKIFLYLPMGLRLCMAGH